MEHLQFFSNSQVQSGGTSLFVLETLTEFTESKVVEHLRNRPSGDRQITQFPYNRERLTYVTERSHFDHDPAHPLRPTPL
ncbi:MAG: hypothetical protein HC799_02205 [Limnothrix sp. RL_2_0]|nr:hypothetical protein [Limnothrix sp. RL_2_0]